jgi:hypothetical protein
MSEKQKVHFVGVGGVGMGSLAIALSKSGFDVSGSDGKLYEPMKSALSNANIRLLEGYSGEHVQKIQPDRVVIGNVIRKENPEAQAWIQSGVPFCSFPEAVRRFVIQDKLSSKSGSLSQDDYNDIWSSIIANDGSCQHLDILTDDEKAVFKTSMEIDQRWVIELASDRQHYIDQAQSLNLFFRPDANIKYLHAIHFMAWKKRLKTLYYCRSEKIGKADKVSKKIERQVIKELDMVQVAQGNDCIACEG